MKPDTNTPNLPGIESLVQPFKFPAQPYEYKVTPLRECLTPADMQDCDTPDKVAAYWRLHIATNPYFDPERECLAVILLNTRKRVKGHQLVSIGTLDTLLVSPTAVFRLAVVTRAASIVIAISTLQGTANHPKPTSKSLATSSAPASSSKSKSLTTSSSATPIFSA